MFAGRTLVVATMHEKEKILGPMAEKELGVNIIVPPDLNTDLFGTFTGETPRIKSPIETAREKAETALKLTGCDLALASEGSFGPHPIIGIVPANEEWLLLIDKKNGFEIIVRELSTETNYDSRNCSSIEELMLFAKTAGFPDHGLIIRSKHSGNSIIKKGIMDQDELLTAAKQLLETEHEFMVETDMRSMMNPMRRNVIAAGGEKLIAKLKSTCSECDTPGFDVEDMIPGLPCSQCGLPTRTPVTYIFRCKKCGHEKRKDFPKEKTTEDPMYCDYCNP